MPANPLPASRAGDSPTRCPEKSPMMHSNRRQVLAAGVPSPWPVTGST